MQVKAMKLEVNGSKLELASCYLGTKLGAALTLALNAWGTAYGQLVSS